MSCRIFFKNHFVLMQKLYTFLTYKGAPTLLRTVFEIHSYDELIQ